LDPKITLYLKTLSMWMILRNQLIFNKSVNDFCPCKEILFCHKQTEEKDICPYKEMFYH